MNSLTLTRFNQTRTGYTKRDEHQVNMGSKGADDLNLLIQDYKSSKRPARAISFGVYEDGEMSGATWRRSTALMLDYAINDDAAITDISVAADVLKVGYWLLDGQDRYGQRTLSVIVPLSEHVSKDRYARLIYVLLEELKAAGCRYHLVKGTSAMTHMLHLGSRSEAAWIEGPALNPTAKIKQTKWSAQNMDRDRFTVGSQAAQVQQDAPMTTACDPGLFQW